MKSLPGFSEFRYEYNMGPILTGRISDCDLIILNKTDDLTRDKLNNVERTLKAINKSAGIAGTVIYNEAGKDTAIDTTYRSRLYW